LKTRTMAGLPIEDQRAEHPDYEPDLNFKKAKAEQHDSGQKTMF